MKRFLSRCIPALAILGFATPSFAQTTGTLNINASVSKACATEDVGSVAMPIAYDVYSSAVGNGVGTANLSVRCSKNILIKVDADSGLNSATAPAGFNRAVHSTTTGESIGYKLVATGVAVTDLVTGTASATSVLGKGKTAVAVGFTATLDSASDPEPSNDYADDVVVTFTPN